MCTDVQVKVLKHDEAGSQFMSAEASISSHGTCSKTQVPIEIMGFMLIYSVLVVFYIL